MRIALVTETFYPAADAATTTTREVADRLADLGHEVLVVAAAPGLTTYRGCRVARIRTMEPVGPGRRSPGHQVRDALAVFRPDLVQVTTPGQLGRKALKHARRLGARTLVVQATTFPRRSAEEWHAKVLARADHLVVTSRWGQADLQRYGAHRVPVWEPGVDALAFTPGVRSTALHERWSRDGRPVVGYVGGLHKRHGVRRLEELAGLPGQRLVVVGDGPQLGWLQRRLPGAVFSGALTGGDLATALATLDVLVHPGEDETCCHVHRAAGASGVPVVAPAAGGVPDAVRDRSTGLLYDPSDARGLIRSVGALTADPAARAALGQRARARAAVRTWTDAVDELVAVHHPAALGHVGTAA